MEAGEGMEVEEAVAHKHPRSPCCGEAFQAGGNTTTKDKVLAHYGLQCGAFSAGKGPVTFAWPKEGPQKSRIYLGGCLYPSIHFGPTRILPADCPTRDHDFPKPTSSFLQGQESLQVLLKFSKVGSPQICSKLGEIVPLTTGWHSLLVRF